MILSNITEGKHNTLNYAKQAIIFVEWYNIFFQDKYFSPCSKCTDKTFQKKKKMVFFFSYKEEGE